MTPPTKGDGQDGKSGPTLHDVAAQAGVSTATVARVLHGNGYVSEATRRRVETAMRKEAFGLNAVASGLKRGRTTTLGALLHETLPNPFFAEVALGIEHAATEQGYNVLVYNARGSAEHERAGVDAFLSQRVEAIVFAKPVDARNVEPARRAGVVVVEVEKPRFAPSARSWWTTTSARARRCGICLSSDTADRLHRRPAALRSTWPTLRG